MSNGRDQQRNAKQLDRMRSCHTKPRLHDAAEIDTAEQMMTQTQMWLMM